MTTGMSLTEERQERHHDNHIECYKRRRDAYGEAPTVVVPHETAPCRNEIPSARKLTKEWPI